MKNNSIFFDRWCPVVLFMYGLLASSLYGEGEPQASPPPGGLVKLDRKRLQSFPVKRSDLEIKNSWKGIVEAEVRQEVVASSYLIIKKVAVKDGQEVKKGDVLIEVDKGAAEKKKAELDTAYELASLDFKNLQIDFSLKESDYHNKTIELEKNIIAKKVFEQAKSTYLIAKNSLKTKEIELANQKNQIAAVSLDLNQLDFTAPIDGVISGLITADQVGQQINSQTKLATVSRLDKFVFRLQVEDTYVHRLGVGTPAMIKLDNFPEKTFSGKVSQVGLQPIGNDFSMVSKYEVVIRLDPAGELKEQLAGKGEIVFAHKEQILTIPLTAISSLGGDSMVLSAANDKADSALLQTKIEVGITSALEAEIISGLSEGALVFKEREEQAQ